MPEPNAREVRPPTLVALTVAPRFPRTFIGPGLWPNRLIVIGTPVAAPVTGADVHTSARCPAQDCRSGSTLDAARAEGDREGATSSDVGDTVSARRRHGVADSTLLEFALLLAGLGLRFLIGRPYPWHERPQAGDANLVAP